MSKPRSHQLVMCLLLLAPWGPTPTAPARLAGSLAGAQQPSRDAAVTSRTATISGTVFVAGSSKQPARRVRVTLTNIARTSPGQTTTSDDAGAFAFRDVPAGRFEVQAFKNGYLRASFGAARPERAGTPIVVKDGEAITNIAVTIARGGVITGVVRDIRGRPVPGVSVRVLKFGYHAVTGERTPTAPPVSSSSSSDDRGQYRAYGLPPGGYLVLANPNPATGRSGGPGVDDIRPLTAAEVQQALQAARAGAAATPLPPSLSSSSARVNYAPVFHPGVTNISAAATVALGLSEERTGVDITIQHVQTAIVSGAISAPSGDLPQFLTVRLVPAGPQSDLLAGAGLPSPSTQPRADGTYLFAGIAPGTYTVKASTRGGRAGAPGPALSAAAEVNVSGQNIDVPLTLQPGVTVNGRVVFEGSRPAPAELETLSFRLMAPGTGGASVTGGGGRGVAAPTGVGRVDAEGRFSLADVPPDAYQFATQWTTPGASEKWTIKSSMANGREAFDTPLHVNPNEPLEWTVTFTDAPTTVSGVLQDRSGRAATDYFILVFSTDRKFWTSGSRRVLMTRPATDGAFAAKGLPAGEYFLAALTDLDTGEWNDPTFLEQLVTSSAKVTLRDGETTRQDLRIGG